jgi:hypothetical protein
MVYPVPFAGASYPTLWIDVLKHIEQLPVKAMAPGHGLVQHDHTYTRLQRELIKASTWRDAWWATTAAPSITSSPFSVARPSADSGSV